MFYNIILFHYKGNCNLPIFPEMFCGKGKENCDTDVMSQLVNASGNPPDSDPFRPDPQLEVQYVQRGMYRLFNKTQSNLPFIYFEVPKDQSILRAVYDPTTVRDDATLKAELVRRDREWILHVSGELLKCPGA